MRFFHKLAQAYLADHINNVIQAADKRDENPLPVPLPGVLGKIVAKAVIDIDLSDAKKEAGRAAVENIGKLSESELIRKYNLTDRRSSLDDFAYDQFDALVAVYDEEVNAAIKRHGASNKGGSVKALTKCYDLLKNIKALCQEMALWECDFDEKDPLCIFQYYMAYYVCLRMGTDDTFAEEKSNIVKERMQKVSKAIAELTTAQSRLDHVSDQVKYLKLTNQAMCAQNKHGIDLPIAGTILGLKVNTSFSSGVGALGQLLDVAERKLKDLDQVVNQAYQGGYTAGQNRLSHTDFDVTVFDSVRRSQHADTVSTSEADGVDAYAHMDITTAVQNGVVERVMQIANSGVGFHTPMQSLAGNSIFEYAMQLRKAELILAIKDKSPINDPRINDSFLKACRDGNWQSAQIIDKERALAAQLDMQYKTQLHWYSFNNTAVKDDFMAAAQNIARNPMVNKDLFYSHLARSETAVYRQLQFWNSAPTRTTTFFRQELSTAPKEESSYRNHHSASII